jgi:hypothetical protein
VSAPDPDPVVARFCQQLPEQQFEMDGQQSGRSCRCLGVQGGIVQMPARGGLIDAKPMRTGRAPLSPEANTLHRKPIVNHID